VRGIRPLKVVANFVRYLLPRLKCIVLSHPHKQTGAAALRPPPVAMLVNAGDESSRDRLALLDAVRYTLCDNTNASEGK